LLDQQSDGALTLGWEQRFSDPEQRRQPIQLQLELLRRLHELVEEEQRALDQLAPEG
jgi:hypothetical protein